MIQEGSDGACRSKQTRRRCVCVVGARCVKVELSFDLARSIIPVPSHRQTKSTHPCSSCATMAILCRMLSFLFNEIICILQLKH